MRINDLDIDQIHAAFSPASAIDDPEMFVGRSEQIKKGILSLSNPGGLICIHGVRGIGKSSVARQVKVIAEGGESSKILPNHLRLSRFLPKKEPEYIVHYIHCDSFVTNIESLVRRILFGDENCPSLFSLTKSGDKKLLEVKKTMGLEGGTSLFGVNLGAHGQEESSYGQHTSEDIVQIFRQTLGFVQRDNTDKTGIIILVDEFDTIKDKTGFASLVKVCSSKYVKFGVVGIANSVSELISDHLSISRQVDLIPIDLMPRGDLEKIIRKAEYMVRDAIVFDEESTGKICDLSEGYPYFVHLLGREAMLEAFNNQQPRIDVRIVEYLSEEMNNGRLSTVYEGEYQKAIKNSQQREMLLKLFSEDNNDEIFSEPIYATAKELGITNPSQLMKELTGSENQPGVLTKIRDRYFRFSDPVFKVYSRMRNWKYDS